MRGKVCVVCTTGGIHVGVRRCRTAHVPLLLLKRSCDDWTHDDSEVPILTDVKLTRGQQRERSQRVIYIAELTTYNTRPCLLDKVQPSPLTMCPLLELANFP